MIQTVSIKDIAEFISTGKTPPTKQTEYFNGEIQWYTPGDLDKSKYLRLSNRTLTKLAFLDKKAVSFPSGTLLVACIGDIGKLGITTQDSSSNQQITGIKPNSNTDVNYLFYWFKHNKKHVQFIANNAVVPILNNRRLEQVKIPLPPLAEQQKIAAILDAADALRQKDQQLIDHYTTLSQSLFLKMFGDPVTNPMGWDISTLKDVIVEGPQNGLYKPSSAYGSGVKIIRIDSFHNDIVQVNNLKRVKIETTELDKFEISEGDFVINRVNSPSHLGKCGLVPKENEKLVFESNMMRIKFNGSVVSNSYMLFILSSTYMKNQILNSSKDAVNQSSINQKDVNSFKVPMPPITLQNQFADRIALIEKQKQQAQTSLEQSNHLFNSLLQKAFKGKLSR